jgi:ketosteroid isomerase-like protein
MYKRSVFITIITLALGIQAMAQTADDAAFRALIKQMTDAQIAYEPGVLDKIYTADYIEISPAGEFDPRDKVLGFYKPESRPDPAKVSVSVDASEFSVRNYGKTAIVITKLTFSMTMEGKQAPPRSMRAMVVFRKDGGTWKIASVQYTGIRPPAQKPAQK